MLRKNETEILDGPGIPDAVVQRAYRDIASIHHLLGDVRCIIRAIQDDAQPVRRILDVGCGTGLVLQHIGEALGVEVAGVDIRPRPEVCAAVPILQADACLDRLPECDIAFCMYLSHHLHAKDLIRLIRNVGRYSRRFILLDLVRHPLPLALFRLFVAPLICKIDAEDGRRSIRRSYTPEEFNRITVAALAGSQATFRQSVAPFRTRQVVDIDYRTWESEMQPETQGEQVAWLR